MSKELNLTFKLENYLNGKEKRTTLMIKNIPNKYNIEQTLNEINENGFKNKYNCFYLPIDPNVSLLFYKSRKI